MNDSVKSVIQTDRRFYSREEPSNDIMNVLGIPMQFASHLRIMDRKGPLVLIHYLSFVGEEVPVEIRHVRGLILDTTSMKLVCRSFPYGKEVTYSESAEEMEKTLQNKINNLKFFYACEGTVVRLFHYGGEWILSTHRKIDALTSYWSGITFGQMFSELRQFDYSELSEECCYILLMSHRGTELIYPINDDGQIMLLGVINMTSRDFVQNVDLRGVVQPEAVICTDVSSMGGIIDECVKSACYKRIGLMAIDNETNPSPIKIVSPLYSKVRDARGNDASIRARYIVLNGSEQAALLESWFTTGNYAEVFHTVKEQKAVLAKKIHSLYVSRYIKKNFGELPKEEFVTLQRCHTWHTLDRAKNIVTFAKVAEMLETTPGHYLLIMLNRLKEENRTIANLPNLPK